MKSSEKMERQLGALRRAGAAAILLPHVAALVWHFLFNLPYQIGVSMRQPTIEFAWQRDVAHRPVLPA
jgi:hypothetical protein